MRRSIYIGLIFTFLVVSMAQAGVILVSESGLGANGSVDLTALPGTFNSTNTGVSGIPGLTVGIADSGNSFQRLVQSSGWGGNFGPGEQLLWTSGANGPITLTFSSPISGAGMQIQADYFGNFAAMIDAFDTLGNPLGSVTRSDGNSNPGANDSAIFIGILSDSQNIGSLRISVPVASIEPNNFAINGPLIRGEGAAEVPEPGSALLFGAGGLALLAFARRRHSA